VAPPAPRWLAPGTQIGEVADGSRDISGKAFALPVDGGAAGRTEITDVAGARIALADAVEEVDSRARYRAAIDD
jgi:hypothetical protein